MRSRKKVLERFKFGKNFIQVKDYNGVWYRVVGPKWFRVYIAINDTRQESTVSFCGKKSWFVEVDVFLHCSLVHLLNKLNQNAKMLNKPIS